MKPAANRADRNVQQGADLLIATTVKVFQDHDGAMFRTQFAQCRFDDRFVFECSRASEGSLSGDRSAGSPRAGFCRAGQPCELMVSALAMTAHARLMVIR